MGVVAVPIIMGVVYFLLVTPIDLIVRIMGKDLLNKKYDKTKETYWIKRDKPFCTIQDAYKCFMGGDLDVLV